MKERCSDNLEIRMDLAFWLLLSWMVVLVCLAKGIRTSGKVFQVPLNLIFPPCAHHANFNVSLLFQGGLLHCHLPLPHSTHPADNVSHPAWGCQWNSLSICTQRWHMAQACGLSGGDFLLVFWSAIKCLQGMEKSCRPGFLLPWHLLGWHCHVWQL